MITQGAIRTARSFPVRGLAVALLVFGIFHQMRRTGFFVEQAELPLYDLGTRLVWPWRGGHPDIALVTIQDHSLGWPLSDGTLAAALERMVAAEPAVIGIDLIRDRNVEGGGVDAAERLEKIGMDDRVVWVEIEGNGVDPGMAAPPFLTVTGDEAVWVRKVASATFPVDGRRNLTVRRGRIAVWSDDRQRLSLAAMLAWRRHGRSSQEESGTVLARLFEEIGSLSPTAGAYWFGDSGIGREYLLKPVRGAAERFQKASLKAFADGGPVDGTMPVFSLAEIMDPQTDAGWIRKALNGRVVLLGTHDDTTAKDEIAVVGDPMLRGVKLHALASGQLMRELEGEAPVKVLPDMLEDLLVLAACLLSLGCLLPPRMPLAARGLVAVLIVPLAVLTAGLVSLKCGIWIPTAAPMAAGTTTGLCGLLLLWSRTSKERLAYLDVMNSHLGPEVAARVLARNDRMLAGMNRPAESFEATALFGDLLGYSAACQHFHDHATPGDFFAWLNGYLVPAVEITAKHGGFIKQFVGDGIYVIFGFPPENGGEHARRAVDCACELARLIPELNRGLPAGVPRYYLRIGIYTGEIHSSAVGGGRQADLSFLGPTINKASRLESIDKERFDHERYPARILISDPTRARLEDRALAVPYRDGPITLDKRLPPENVWEIHPEDSPQSSETGVS